MTVGPVLDPAALIAYAELSVDVAETVMVTGEKEGVVTGIPAAALAEAGRHGAQIMTAHGDAARKHLGGAAGVLEL